MIINFLFLSLGIVWKIYDDIIDGDSFFDINLHLFKLLQIYIILLTCVLAYYDLPFLILLLIVIIGNTINLLADMLLKFGYNDGMNTLLWFIGQFIILFISYLKIYNLLEYFKIFSNCILYFIAFLIIFFEQNSKYQGMVKILVRIFFIFNLPLYHIIKPESINVCLFICGYMLISVINLAFIQIHLKIIKFIPT